MSFLWHSLPGKVIGFIGMGEIGTEIAKRCRAFEMEILYTKRTRLTRRRACARGAVVDGRTRSSAAPITSA